MQFRPLSDTDWQQFLDWAALENWRVSFQEQRLFHNQWRPNFFALYASGELCGFVSAVAYKESGWIGNLLVPAALRGRGYGSALFDYALQYLQRSQPRRIWLTASEAGQPIYERRGFTVIDRVARWIAIGLGDSCATVGPAAIELINLDRACWGESRTPLINALCDEGHCCRFGGAMGLLQPGVAGWQLGPWLSPARNALENRLLLKQALSITPAGKELLVDTLASSAMELVLRASGFEKQGSNQLMVLSDEPVKLSGVMALASLGSVG